MNQITTEFDSAITDDIVMEESENKEEMTKLLGDSENVLKATLYLKKLFDSNAHLGRIVKVATLDEAAPVTYTIDAETNMILVKNLTEDPCIISINGGDLTILALESVEFPTAGITDIIVSGNVSIIETIYKAI